MKVKRWMKLLGIITAIVAAIILSIVIAAYFLFRTNPDYVLDYLKKHPETTSLYVAKNGEDLITYQSNVARPLASTVKILIAIEYAMQVDEGRWNKESMVPLDHLKRYYYKGTDGGAHEAWLEAMKKDNRIADHQVTLHDVAKGMITYSSNANTDYLIHLLGIDEINERAKALGLEQHEAIYPIVSPLLFSDYLKEEEMTEKELIKKLEQMPIEAYRELAETISLQLKDGTINLEKYTFDLSFDLQRIWSDRLMASSANDYGTLLGIISNDELPKEANLLVRDLLEWPMEVNENNNKLFAHLGSKGGSTAFILNDAMYVENHDGEKIELVILTNDLNLWQQMRLSQNLNAFELNMFTREDYRLKVKKELAEAS